MGIFNLLFKRGKYKKPAKLTLANIKGFTQGHLRHYMDALNILAPEEHIKEQSIYRLDQVSKKSPECLSGEGCKICGCNPVEAVWEDRACKNEEDPCYHEMMDWLTWEQYKLDNHISI